MFYKVEWAHFPQISRLITFLLLLRAMKFKPCHFLSGVYKALMHCGFNLATFNAFNIIIALVKAHSHKIKYA